MKKGPLRISPACPKCLGVIGLPSDDLYGTPQPDGGPGFWWSVEFEAESGGDGNKNPAWTEERLFDFAALSGAMGSELVEEGSGTWACFQPDFGASDRKIRQYRM